MASLAGVDPSKPRPFVYLSAEDIFRPVIPARYIETKREAEQGIEQMMSLNSQFRGVYIRPSVFIFLMTGSFYLSVLTIRVKASSIMPIIGL